MLVLPYCDIPVKISQALSIFYNFSVFLTCDDLACNNGGSCEEMDDGPVCLCAAGWTGTTCDEGE